MGTPFTSSIGKKLIMSISGAFLFLFLVFHMSMNLVPIFSPETYDAICGFLGSNWYAVAGTAVLAAGVVVHIIFATWLTLSNRSSRGDKRYAVTAQPKSVSWSSRNMFVLGTVIILGLLLHLYHFWYNMMFAELTKNHDLGKYGPTDGSAYVADIFSQPLYVVIYLVWLAALWLHLTHGIWSMLHTVGFNNQKWLKRIKYISWAVATLIVLGFAAVVLVFFFRSLSF